MRAAWRDLWGVLRWDLAEVAALFLPARVRYMVLVDAMQRYDHRGPEMTAAALLWCVQEELAK